MQAGAPFLWFVLLTALWEKTYNNDMMVKSQKASCLQDKSSDLLSHAHMSKL